MSAPITPTYKARCASSGCFEFRLLPSGTRVEVTTGEQDHHIVATAAEFVELHAGMLRGDFDELVALLKPRVAQ